MSSKLSLKNPCGSIPLERGIFWITIGECIFAFVSIFVHMAEAVKCSQQENKVITIVFLFTYFLIDAVIIVTGLIIILGTRHVHLRKCQNYLLVSIIIWFITIATLIGQAVSYKEEVLFSSYYEYIFYPLWLVFKPYPMWIVKCFIVKSIREKRRIRSYSSGKLKPYQPTNMGPAESLIAKHGFEDLLEELNFNTEDEIFMHQLKVDYNQPLRAADNFAVSKGVLALSDGNFKDVAIKIFKPSLEVRSIKAMLSEAKILAMINPHENILKYYGIVLENIHKGKVTVVLEYCAKGYLETFLQNMKENFTDQLVGDKYDPYIQESLYENIMAVTAEKFYSRDLVRWSYELANGMEFLHRKLIIYGNLATKHVIICDNNTVKICQFTVAAQLYMANSHTTLNDIMKEPFPWRWMAIECMENIEELNFTGKSDVWSYGVTIWEIFSMAHLPYEGKSVSDFFPILKEGYRLERPPYASAEIYEIMKKCWSREPSDRPSFGKIKGALETIRQALMQNDDSDEE